MVLVGKVRTVLLSRPSGGAGRAAGDILSECFARYEAQSEMCNAIVHIGGARAVALRKQRAFKIYQECRGY